MINLDAARRKQIDDFKAAEIKSFRQRSLAIGIDPAFVEALVEDLKGREDWIYDWCNPLPPPPRPSLWVRIKAIILSMVN